MPTELTQSTYNTILDTTGVAVVQFTAVWCAPCRMITPVLTELESDGKISYYKVDVDANPSLVTEFGIKGIPYLIYYKDGKKVDAVVGMQPRRKIEQTINNL